MKRSQWTIFILFSRCAISFYNEPKSKIEKIVADYLLEQRKLWADVDYLTIRISQIEARILNNAVGILDIINTTVNGQKENLTLTKYQIPTMGSVASL